jgi:AAA domain
MLVDKNYNRPKPTLKDIVPDVSIISDIFSEMQQDGESILSRGEPSGKPPGKPPGKHLRKILRELFCPTSIESILDDSILKKVKRHISIFKDTREQITTEQINEKSSHHNSFKRDYDLERKIILISKIELRLLATLREHTGPYSWLPNAFKESKGYLVDGYKIISKTHAINPRDDIMWVQQNLPMLETYIDLLKEAISLNREAIKEPSISSDDELIYDPDYRCSEPNKDIVKIVNANVVDLSNKISTPDKILFGRVIPPPDSLRFQPFIFSDLLHRTPKGYFNCFGLYCLINNLDEDTAISELMELENITDDNFSTQGLFKRDSWHRSRFYNDFIYNNNFSVSEFIDFKSSNGRLIGKVEINKSKDDYVLLPVTQWYRRGDERAFDLHLPFGKNVPLYNLDLICNEDKSAPIYITENLLIAHNMKSSLAEQIWTSWPNWAGEDSLRHVNLEPLLDREVIYIMDQEKAQAYARAIEHYVYLKNIKDLTFIEDHSSFAEKCLLNRKGFLDEANKLGLCHKKNDKNQINVNEKLSLFSAAEDVELQELQFIIKPIIPEKSIILLYSDFGVGKSFAALSWAYGVSQGCDICNRLEVPSEKKILYIDSEMGKEIMQERIGYMKKIFGNDSEKTNNFLWHSVASENQIQNINIADESGQNIIEGLLDLALHEGSIGESVSFLVLDNISTLTSGISNHSSWMKVFKWLYKLKSKCSVLILHHENRAGKYLGSVLQGITVDSKIHLLAPELKTREIEFDVVIDKARRTYGKAKAPFTTGINLNGNNPQWITYSEEEIAKKEKFKNMSKQEKNKYLKVLKDKLGNNENIADFLGISLATLYNWKKELK